MTKRILDTIIVVASVFAIITAVVIAGVLNRYFTQRLEEEIITEARLIGRGAEESKVAYFSTASIGNLHVTWIDTDGSVKYDSNMQYDKNYFTDKAFTRAKGFGEYKKSEYSFKNACTEMKYSFRLKDGSVIMVSDVKFSLREQFLDILRSLMIGMVILAFAALVIANLVSRRIVRPINNIDLEDPKIDKSLPELSPLLNRLRTQNQKIANQMYELRQSREQFIQITENMSEGLIVTDVKLNVLSSNSSALRLIGAEFYTEGKSVFSLNNSESFRRCLQNAAGGVHSETVLHTYDGDREIIASPVNGANTINGIVILIMDVTEKQQLETMRREFTSNASKKNITGSVTGEHIVYNGNRTILDEIIYNLSDNAIKYGVENGTYEVKISHIPKKVFITVTDDGVGIPQQSVGRIFERFYRVDKSRSRKVNGTGLGLSIVKHGVMYHGGEIRCESKPDKGSVFTVELPV